MTATPAPLVVIGGPTATGKTGLAIALAERFEFAIHDSFATGGEVANVGTISAFLPGGNRIDTEGVFVYRVGPDGLIKSMRAFWEVDRAMATLRQVEA